MEWTPPGRLVCRVGAASLPFLRECLDRTEAAGQPFVVYLFLPASHHTLGSHRIQDWCPETGRLVMGAADAVATGGICHLLAERWAIDLIAGGVTFAIGDDRPPFEPHALLHGVLSDGVYDWCGGSGHRLGRSCLMEWHAAYPERSAFARARAVVQRYRYALVILYGSAWDEGTTGGLQAILFHPCNGETCRVHFGGHGALMPGEPGDQ